MKIAITETINDVVQVQETEVIIEISDFDTGAGAVLKSTVTGKGSLIVGTASAVVDELAAGADGELLAADSSTTSGLKWVAVESTTSTKYVEIIVFPSDTACSVGDGKGELVIPPHINNYRLSYKSARLETAGTTGTMDIQIRNATKAADMLSTKITVDSTEVSSLTAAAPAVIDTDHDDVSTDDKLKIDVDAIHTTPGVGLVIVLGFTP